MTSNDICGPLFKSGQFLPSSSSSHPQGGGWLVGALDSRGEYTGAGIAFLYPDLSTALVGQFHQGILVQAQEARLTMSTLEAGVLVPSFCLVSPHPYQHWPSSVDRVLCPLHQADPYESRVVRAATSLVEGGGDGLYTTRTVPPYTVVAFYNGVRIPPEVSNPHGTTGYCIFVDWGKSLPFPFPWVKEGEQIDVPPMYQGMDDYTATLAHKVNHSFNPNCEFTNFCHPCYGLLPAVTTMEEVAVGEELTINYSLDMQVNTTPAFTTPAFTIFQG